MKPYRKRAKGSWNAGKGCKGDGPERQFSKREIQQQLAEAEENYLERYRKGPRKRNEKARLEYRVRWLAAHLEKYGNRSYCAGYFREELAKARAKLKEIQDE